MSLLLKLLGLLVIILGISLCTSHYENSKRAAATARTEQLLRESEPTQIPLRTELPKPPAPPPERVWQYATTQDAMGRGPIRQAWVESQNQVEFDFPYKGPQRATLLIRKHPKHGQDVILSIERGQFLCGIDDCYINARFDSGKPSAFLVLQPSDHSTEHVFLSNTTRFLKALRAASIVSIEAEFYQEGHEVFLFKTADLTWQ